MKPESPAPPQLATRVSRLAVTSAILAALSFLLLYLAAAASSGILAISAIVCMLLAPVSGTTALIAIEGSSGQLIGKGCVFGSFLVVSLSFASFVLIPCFFNKPKGVIGAKAGSAITGLCYASKSYNNDYGTWPQPNNSGDLVLIFNGLRDPRTGKDISSERPDLLEQNPHRTQFMEFKLKDVTPPSGRANATNALAFYDPWGIPYAFCFDNGKGGVYYVGPLQNGVPTNPQPWKDTRAYDNQIPLPFSDGASTNVFTGGFAFFSNGPDTRSGTGPSFPGSNDRAKAYEDDIRSWR